MGKSPGYGWAIVASLILHGLLLALLIIGWVPKHKPDLIKPNYIHATLMAETSKSKRVTKPAVKPPPASEKRPDPPRDDVAEKQQEEKQQLEQKREQETKQKQAVEQKKKLELEKKRQQDEEKRKKEEQVKKEQVKKDEEKRKQDAAKKAADEKRKREQDIADALEREEAEAQADEEANADVQSYSDYIRERMERNWSRPLSARNGMSVDLSIQLLRNGQVVSVVVIKSSGDAAFDRSAEQAVRKVERFDRLRELPERVFNDRFRKFTLTFTAQDLRL